MSSANATATCSFPTDCEVLERLQPCDCVVYGVETPGMCGVGRLLVIARVGFHDVTLWLLLVVFFLVVLLTVRVIRLDRYRQSDDSTQSVAPVYGWPMAILPTDPSRQVAHSGHRVRAVLGLLAFLACTIFMLVGRIGLLVNSVPGRHAVSGFAISGIVCGIGAQLATAGVLSVWQSLYFSRYDVYGRAPPNFFMFAYAAFPLRHLPALARKLPLWLATRMTRRFVHVVHVCTVLAYTMPVIVATLLLGSLFVNVPADDPNRLRIIERAAATTEAFFLIFLILSLAWNIDFGLALIWNRHVGVAGGEGRRGVFGTALAQRQDLFVALATALQIICASQAVRIVSGACPYSEALNNGDAYIQAISDVTNFAFYCVFALALVDCVVPRSLLVSVEDTFAFTLVDRRRAAPDSAVRMLDGDRAAHVAANIFAEQRSRRPSVRRASLGHGSAGAPEAAAAAAAAAGEPEERPTLLKRVSTRIGFAPDADGSDEKAALYVDWRRARPDVLVLREAGPSHDVPPFESVELVNASARLGELMKATIALLLLIFRFTVQDRAFWQHLIVAIAFFLSLVSADSARTAALVMRPWVRLYRRREGREPASGLAKPRPWRDALSSACATLLFAALIATWIYLAVERDPIQLGVGTYAIVTVFFVVQSVLVLFFAPFTTNRRTQVSQRVQSWIERLTTHMPSVLTMGGNLSYSASSSADIALVDWNDDDSLWMSADSKDHDDSDKRDADDDPDSDEWSSAVGSDVGSLDEQPSAAARWRSTLLAALDSPMSTHIAWRMRWFAHDMLIVTEVVVGVLTAYTIYMQGLALAILVAVVWLVAGAVMRAAWERHIAAQETDEGDDAKSHGGVAVVVFLARVIVCLVLVIFVHAPFASEPRIHPETKPLIQGHRGVWSSEVAENSFAAIDFAVRAHWSTVEVDIRKTKDDQLVVMHDSTLDRTVNNATGSVDQYTLEQLRQFTLIDSNETIHTLAEHLAYAKARNITVFIDLKPSYAASFAGPLRDFRRQQRTDAVIDVSVIMRALATACSLGMLHRTMLSTAEMHFLAPIAAVAPEYTLARDYIWYSNDISFKLSPDTVFSVSIEMLVFNPWLIRNAHRAGKQVVVFFLALELTPMIKYAVAMGADYLMLNTPEGAADAGFPPHRLTPGGLPNAVAVAQLCNVTGRAWQSLPPMNVTAMPGPLGMMSRDTPSKSDEEWGYRWDIYNGSFPPTRDDEGLCESLAHPFNSCTSVEWRDDALGVWTQMGLNDSTIEALMKN